MRILRCGEAALLTELDDLTQVMALDRELRSTRLTGVIDIVPAARTVFVRFDPATVQAEAIRAWITASTGAAPDDPVQVSPTSGTLVIPVVYDGDDLAEVARTCGLTPDEVVARHTESVFTVAFCGFAPGFAYLTGVPAVLRVARRSAPRTRVPGGSVALADEFTAVYPQDSPGGWQLIGRTELRVFDVNRDPPALLVPGTKIRFDVSR